MWQTPSKFLMGLPFTTLSMWPGWIHEINPIALGNVPFGLSGEFIATFRKSCWFLSDSQLWSHHQLKSLFQAFQLSGWYLWCVTSRAEAFAGYRVRIKSNELIALPKCLFCNRSTMETVLCRTLVCLQSYIKKKHCLLCCWHLPHCTQTEPESTRTQQSSNMLCSSEERGAGFTAHYWIFTVSF